MKSSNIKHTISSAIKAGVNSIPAISPFYTFYSEYIDLKWKERRELWEAECIKRIDELESKLKNSINNDVNTASLLAYITQNAMTDIEEDKIKLYATAFFNSITNKDLSKTKIHIFLNILKSISKAHITLFKILSIDKLSSKYDKSAILALDEIEPYEDPHFGLMKLEILELLFKDLKNYGLISDAVEHLSFLEDCEYINQASELGNEFLKFIDTK